MNRKQFVESLGASCVNWTWSWSFVNHERRQVIFGSWDTFSDGSKSLILSDTWTRSRKGRKQPAYSQSREHIRLILEEGYTLYTFPMIRSLADEDDEFSPSKIAGFTPEVTERELIRVGKGWYAASEDQKTHLPEEVDSKEIFTEGAIKSVTVNTFERNGAARRICLEKHGYGCCVCGFNFEEKYGEIGRNYIHVHHVVPIAEVRKKYELNPTADLVPVCPNCHAMLHSVKPALKIDELKELISVSHEIT
ncbi:HNH endonuclease [Desulfosediminicola sp.]|uniref:HNH endonuclease n=1 Tax=Desulfosediminicola sp. TaxID=2886825 RepID=UPI003AF2B083